MGFRTGAEPFRSVLIVTIPPVQKAAVVGVTMWYRDLVTVGVLIL
jgi:hypothetical protein